MTPDLLFALSNILVLPFWLLMIAAPGWGLTRRIVASPWIAAAPAVLYVTLVAPQLLDLLVSLANPQLAAIAALLGTPLGATIAWVHFLTFDLFVGRWAYLDARERGLSAWIVSPLLALILLLGPLGFLLYLLARLLRTPSTASPGQLQ